MNDQTRKEWAEIAAVLNPAPPPDERLPHLGAVHPDTPYEARVQILQLKAEALMTKPPGTWSENDREIMRAAINITLREGQQ
jgi:hypothetical protein